MRRRDPPPVATTSAVEAELAAAVAAAQNGDEEAFRKLYRDIQPRLLRYLHKLVSADAEDVAAETWMQISRDIGAFRGDYDAFRGWAATVARHRAMDHLRRTGRRPATTAAPVELGEVMGSDDTERDALDRLSTDRAIAVICTLPRDQAEAVLLRVVMGLDAKAAGRVLGKRPGAVRQSAHRGLRRLAEKLQDAGLGPRV